MKLIVPLAALSIGAAAAQPVSVGAIGGTLLTNVNEEGSGFGRYGGRYEFKTQRYTGGPSVEIRVADLFIFRSEALYKHIRLDRFEGPAPTAVITQESLRASVWEVPLLLRRNVGRHAFAAVGSTLRTIPGFEGNALDFITFPVPDPWRTRTYQADGDFTAGWTGAAGVIWKRKVRIEPELRFTRWTSKRYLVAQNQVELLLGLRWP